MDVQEAKELIKAGETKEFAARYHGEHGGEIPVGMLTDLIDYAMEIGAWDFIPTIFKGLEDIGDSEYLVKYLTDLVVTLYSQDRLEFLESILDDDIFHSEDTVERLIRNQVVLDNPWLLARVVYYQRRYFPDVQGREYLDHALLLGPDPDTGEESIPDLEWALYVRELEREFQELDPSTDYLTEYLLFTSELREGAERLLAR